MRKTFVLSVVLLLAFTAILNARTRSRTESSGDIIFYDGTEVVMGIGSNVVQDLADFNVVAWGDTNTNTLVAGDSALYLLGWAQAFVSAGTGLSTVQEVDSVGGVIKLNASANDNDGIQIQRRNASFVADSTNKGLLWFSTRIKFDEATQSDFIIGLCSPDDATLIGGMADGIYFIKADGSTTLSGAVESNTIAATDAYGTAMAADTWYKLDIIFKDNRIEYFVNGSSIAIQSTGIPASATDVLVPSAAWLNGAGTAQNEGLFIDYMRVVQTVNR